MAKPKNAMELFTLLDKSNCRVCGEKTCLAFAGAVHTGKRAVGECPRLDPDIVGRFSARTNDSPAGGNESDNGLREMIDRVLELDFEETARRTAGSYDGNVLRIKMLGKDFGIDRAGKFVTQIHVNPWVIGPFLEYLLCCEGRRPQGDWLSYRELQGGAVKYPLFAKRGEEALFRVAVEYPDLFADMVEVFSAKEVAPQFAADVSVVLHPLPLVPLMICYWRPDEGMGASLNFFFDRTVEHNLGVDGAFSLGTGLTQMFERFARLHGA